MRELLIVLAEQLIFLLENDMYRISNSRVGSSYDDAFVILEGKNLVWRLVRDRGQIFFECTSPDDTGDHWYSTDLLMQLLMEGESVESAEFTKSVAQWLEINIDEIQERFQPRNVKKTKARLQSLKKRRAQELFGDMRS